MIQSFHRLSVQRKIIEKQAQNEKLLCVGQWLRIFPTNEAKSRKYSYYFGKGDLLFDIANSGMPIFTGFVVPRGEKKCVGQWDMGQEEWSAISGRWSVREKVKEWKSEKVLLEMGIRIVEHPADY